MRADRRGGAPASLRFVPRRWSRRRRWFGAVVGLATVGLLPAALADSPPDGAGADPTEPAPSVTSPATSDLVADPVVDAVDAALADADEPGAATPQMARVGRLELFLPSPAPIVVGYHEAAHVSAIDLTPVGTVRDDRNPTRTRLPAAEPAGRPYLVLTSRGRAAGPTSAVDVVVPEGEPILSPVTGAVTDVRSYHLYGAHEDVRIEIVPDRRPDLRVVLIHLDAALVRAGDRVVGGATPIAATARLLPFSSHIDRETEPERLPHVHVELQPVDRPRPGDDAADDPEGVEPGG